MTFVEILALPSTTGQSDSKKPTLPAELIHQILCFADPLSLVRLRTVSKQFHAIICDPELWRTIYKAAPFARPSGPFPWQSTRLLQRNLVRCAGLEENWTSQRLKIRNDSRRQVPHDPQVSGALAEANYYQWVDNRWIIFDKKLKTIVSYDIETGSEQILWNDGQLSHWTSCSTVSAEGHLLYLALNTGNWESQHPNPVKLLEFRMDYDSGHLSEPAVFDVPSSEEDGRTAINCKGEAPFVQISIKGDKEDSFFDMRNRTFYKFPECISPLPSNRIGHHDTLLTKTHVIAWRYYSGCPSVIQAFVVPDPPTSGGNGVKKLCLTHEHEITPPMPFYQSLLRNSIVDSVTGSTTIRFRHTNGSQYLCTEFTLPRQETNAILPISVNTYEIFKIEGFEDDNHIYEVCDNGFVRGFYEGKYRGKDSKFALCKFTVDATGERCVAVVGDPYPSELLNRRSGYGLMITVLWFDGFRGSICYRRLQPSYSNFEHDSHSAVVIDFD